MGSKTACISRQIQYRQWMEDIRVCRERPKGMTVDDWCKDHGINKNTFYWRMKALKEICIEETTALYQPQTEENEGRFVELKEYTPPKVDVSDSYEESLIRIKKGKLVVEIPCSLPESMSEHIIMAVLHAE